MIFSDLFKGLPKNADLKIEASQKRLPETVLTFVEQEKWPQGTYSFVGIKVKEDLSVWRLQFVQWDGGRMNLVTGFHQFLFVSGVR